MFLVLNQKGEPELAVKSDKISALASAASEVFPRHTTLYRTWDEATREDNPAGGEASADPPTAELAMEKSGLPWNPSGIVPAMRHVTSRRKRGVGFTMADVLAKYPMTRGGLKKAHEDLLPYFPNTKAEYGWKQWRTPDTMADNLLRSNTKTEKAIQGSLASGGYVVPPSYAVGIVMLPATFGPKLSREDADVAQRRYDEATKKYRLKMPIVMKQMPLVGENGRMVTLCVGASSECISSCLVFTGQNAAVKHNDYSKLFTTRALFFQPLAFARMLLYAIEKHVEHCEAGVRFKTKGRRIPCDPYVRLNVYSDVPWELLFPEVFDFAMGAFGKKLQFFDYTKVPGRGAKPFENYDLTFSYSGTERNLEYAKQALRDGQRVAMVFLRKPKRGTREGEGLTDIQVFSEEASTKSQKARAEREGRTAESVVGSKTLLGYPVIDGDLYDMRSLDPAPCIVGLRYKVPQKIEHRATAGKFVVDPKARPNAKFVVRVNVVDGEWVTDVTPAQTGVDKSLEMTESAFGSAAE